MESMESVESRETVESKRKRERGERRHSDMMRHLGAMFGPSWDHREPCQCVRRDIVRCREVFVIGGTSLGQFGSLSGGHLGPPVEPLAALPLSPIRICGAMRTHIEIQARMQIHAHKQKHMHTHITVCICLITHTYTCESADTQRRTYIETLVRIHTRRITPLPKDSKP